MPLRPFHWPSAALGATIALAGCTGEPRIYAGKPIVLHPRHAGVVRPRHPPAAPATAKVAARPDKPVTCNCQQSDQADSPPELTAAEKERLFQRFQETLSRTAQTAAPRQAAP